MKGIIGFVERKYVFQPSGVVRQYTSYTNFRFHSPSAQLGFSPLFPPNLRGTKSKWFSSTIRPTSGLSRYPARPHLLGSLNLPPYHEQRLKGRGPAAARADQNVLHIWPQLATIRQMSQYQGRDRLWKLENELVRDPTDAQKHLVYMREANKIDASMTVRHFEENPDIPISPEIVREYVKALSDNGTINNADIHALLRKIEQRNESGAQRVLHSPRLGNRAKSSGYSSPKVADPVSDKFVFSLDSNTSPIKVEIAEKNKYSLWKLVRQGGMFLIIVAGISVFAESLAQNVQKGLGMGRTKLRPVENTNTVFDDVKGCDEVRDELEEIIAYLKDPKRFSRLGARLPKGVLLSGAPGTGKTLIARAIAGEAKVPFIQASGSEFEEMFVGVGARRIRDLFAAARKHSPCIVFIDEIDAVGSKRSNKDNTAVRMTLNQLLVELDGFEQNDGIVLICATNFAESLDHALTRPGRLDKTVVVPFPDLIGRTEILELYGEKMVMDDDVDLKTIAQRSAGMTGADLFNILNVAAVRSCADGKPSISVEYIEQAFDRVVVGLERRNPMSAEERAMTAYHESGHTLVALNTKGADPIHKATIMPRGSTLGVTWTVPEERHSDKFYELQGRLDVLMGGRASEELVYGEDHVTAGCTNDLKVATSLARDMVMKYGMNKNSPSGLQYIEAESYGALSEDVRKSIDSSVKKLLESAYTRAISLLRSKEAELHRVAQAMIEYETLDREDIELAVANKHDALLAKRGNPLKISQSKTRRKRADTKHGGSR